MPESSKACVSQKRCKKVACKRTVNTVGTLCFARATSVSFHDWTSSCEHPELKATARSGFTKLSPLLAMNW